MKCKSSEPTMLEINVLNAIKIKMIHKNVSAFGLIRSHYSIMCIWNMSRVHEIFNQDLIPGIAIKKSSKVIAYLLDLSDIARIIAYSVI